jgi:hypothetical protein
MYIIVSKMIPSSSLLDYNNFIILRGLNEIRCMYLMGYVFYGTHMDEIFFEVLLHFHQAYCQY